jgi:hypothetical protein
MLFKMVAIYALGPGIYVVQAKPHIGCRIKSGMTVGERTVLSQSSITPLQQPRVYAPAAA